MNKKEKFKQLAERRVNKAISMLRLISNLSNRSLYEFSDGDVKKVLEALNNEISNIKIKFNSKTGNRDGKGFEL